MATGTPVTWSVVIPVKLLTRAKSRLAGLPDTDRQALALAMAADTMAAAIACSSVAAVVVVTDDPVVRAEAGRLGATVTPERGPAWREPAGREPAGREPAWREPAWREPAGREPWSQDADGDSSAGLNLALSVGASYATGRWAGRGLAALTADLPALAADELGAALAAASPLRQAFVPDAAGSGTTLYAVAPGETFRPRFGPRSREQHRNAGAVELDLPGIPGLRQDVDTLADLRSAARIGLGPRSAAFGAAWPER